MSQIEIEKEHAEHPWTTEAQATRIVKEHHHKESLEPFNDLKYTRRGLVGHLLEIQTHASDGSAFQNCKCIEEKHLIGVRSKATEGVTIATDLKEKEFYAWLSPWADKTLDHVLDVLDRNNDAEELAMWATLAEDVREIRHEITNGTFNIPNPASTRAYLPYGLTTKEKESASLRKTLSRCIKKAEIRCCGGHTTDYASCDCNPVAVCRASVSSNPGVSAYGSPKERERYYEEWKKGDVTKTWAETHD